jgi:site-specific DNA-adenine methylase
MPKSLFRYPGGKSKKSILDKLWAKAPKEFSEYREPFVGGGGLFFDIPSTKCKKRWINDIDSNLIAVYDAFRNRPEAFISLCKAIEPQKAGETLTSSKPGGKEIYNARLKEVFDKFVADKDMDRALRYFFLNRTNWGGRVDYDRPSRLYYSNPQGWNIVKGDTLEKAAKHIKGARITNHCASILLKEPGKDVFIYCFPKDSKVKMANRTLKKIQNIEIGDKVLGGRTVKKVFCNHYNGKIVNIKIQGSPFMINITDDHPMMAIKKINSKQEKRNVEKLEKSIKLIDAGKLQIGDYLCVPVGCDNGNQWNWGFEPYKGDPYYGDKRKTKINKISFIQDDIKIANILGLYSAEGTASKYIVHFYFSVKEKEIIKKLCQDIEDVFNYKPVVYEKSPSDSVTTVAIHSVVISSFIRKWVKGKSRRCDIPNKRFSNKILEAPQKILFQILKSWLLGDGGFWNPGNGKGKVTGTSASYELALQMYDIALQCKLRPGFKKRQNCYDVYFSIADEIKKLGYDIESGKSRPQRKITNDYILSRITRISNIDFLGNVYNLHVDKDNLICVDGVMSHNCDPPYVVNSDLAKSSQLYANNFTEEDHIKLAGIIKQCKHNVLISYDDHKLIRELYLPKDGFHIFDEEWTYCGTSSSEDAGEDNKQKKVGKELLITNYEVEKETDLFEE